MFTEDLTEFFDTDELAVTATYAGVSWPGILENEYYEVPGEIGVESSQPLFLCAAADVPTGIRGKTITVSGISYTVRGLRPDGTGITILVLEKV